MGYELEIKVKFEGMGKQKGSECVIELTDLCDDGGDPEIKVDVTKEKAKDSGKILKKDLYSRGTIEEFISKCREVLGIIKEEA